MLTYNNDTTPVVDAKALQQQVKGTIIFPCNERFHKYDPENFFRRNKNIPPLQ